MAGFTPAPSPAPGGGGSVDPLTRSLNDPNVAKVLHLAPDWVVAASGLPLTPALVSQLGPVAYRGGVTGNRAERLLGLQGLPSVVGDMAPGTTVVERAVPPLVPGMWSGLHLVGQMVSTVTPSPWVTDSLRIEARVQKMPMGRQLADNDSGYQEMWILRNRSADPQYSYVEFGILKVTTQRGSLNFAGGTIPPGAYWYLDYADASGTNLEWLALVDDTIDLYGHLNHIIFTMDATTGDVTLTVNDMAQTVPNVDPVEGGFPQPTDETVQAFISGWHGTYFAIGPIGTDPISVLDVTTASTGTPDIAGYASRGGEIMACPTTPRIIGVNALGICNPHPADINIPSGQGWTLVTLVHFAQSQEENRLLYAGPLGVGSGASYGIAAGLGGLSGNTVDWACFISDGTLGGNPFAFPGVFSADPMPDGDFVLTIRVSKDENLSVWIDAEQVGEDVDISVLGDVIPDPTSTPLSFGDGGGHAAYLALFHRAISDDEISYLSVDLVPPAIPHALSIAGLFPVLPDPTGQPDGSVLEDVDGSPVWVAPG